MSTPANAQEQFEVGDLRTKLQRFEEIKQKLTKNPGCRTCHGTGVVGIQLVPGPAGKNNIRPMREQLMLCHCASFVDVFEAQMDRIDHLTSVLDQMAQLLDRQHNEQMIQNDLMLNSINFATRQTLFGGCAWRWQELTEWAGFTWRRFRRFLKYSFTPEKSPDPHQV